ncbi:MAG: HPr(Ser) kinase/phosphatase [Gemmatimonadetes bacterium SCN 70-22]|nr:MAG: HPr(Ser) kinase/phosphatase [Gemmatimonadetes bacterium SCN 70-22]
MNRTVTVGRLFERLKDALQLEQLGGSFGHERDVPNPDLSSPGLAIAGFVARFMHERPQVFGETEMTYLNSLAEGDRRRQLELFFSFSIPCVFVTKGLELAAPMLDIAIATGVPVFRSSLKTNEFYRRAKPLVEDMFAPTATLHGSLADVYGVGVLFTGASGIGKSECVLDLVERGHRLVADDVVVARRRGNDILIGSGHHLQRHFMEIRGVGLIDVPSIFGIRSVRQQKRIEVVVQLMEWTEDAVVERTGLEGELTSILGVELPLITVYLNPGKNITVIAEVIAMNHLLRYAGVHPAETFNQRLMGHMQQKAADVRRYLIQDDE